VMQAVETYFCGSDKDSASARHSFQVDEQRVAAFFSGAGGAGGGRGSGPIAIATFCLDHRAKVWDLLVWSSHRAHSPVAVLTRPQFWDDLDICRCGDLDTGCGKDSHRGSEESDSTCLAGLRIRITSLFGWWSVFGSSLVS
jgi:hypothetical protein